MIFSVQRYVEDYFHRRNLSDVDQYAVSVANCFVDHVGESDEQVVEAVHRIRTVFFRNNAQLVRREFERTLVTALRSHFKKKAEAKEFPGGVDVERKALRKRSRLTIQSIMTGFVQAVEARAIDVFWKSRKANVLKDQAEKIGQSLFALYVKGVLKERGSGLVLREVSSGTGFVDVAIVLGTTLHLIEMKVLRSGLAGVSQLDTYMRKEDRSRGWLLYFDARRPSGRVAVPSKMPCQAGVITLAGIDINPIPPSKAVVRGQPAGCPSLTL